jgi:hypothetical protein
MKNHLIILASVIGFTAGFSACKKKPVVKASLSVVGIWKGYATSTLSADEFGVTYLFKPDGSMRYYTSHDTANSLKYEGAYSIKDRQLVMSYSLIGGQGFNFITSEKCVLNETFTHFDGTIAQDPNPEIKGITSADKQ